MITSQNGVRIGDAERQAAADALQRHLVAGRLQLDEFDARVQRAWAARTQADLAPLFRDLPDLQRARSSRPPRNPAVWRALLVLVIVAVIAGVSLFLRVFPFPLFFLFCFMGMHRRHGRPDRRW